MIKTNRIGLIGIFIAMLGVSVAVFQDDLRLHFSPDSSSVKEKVTKKGLAMVESGTVSAEKHDLVDFLYIGLGLVGLLFSVGSYIVKENHRVSAAAAALGIVALAWQYVLIGVTIAVAVFFLASFA